MFSSKTTIVYCYKEYTATVNNFKLSWSVSAANRLKKLKALDSL